MATAWLVVTCFPLWLYVGRVTRSRQLFVDPRHRRCLPVVTHLPVGVQTPALPARMAPSAPHLDHGVWHDSGQWNRVCLLPPALELELLEELGDAAGVGGMLPMPAFDVARPVSTIVSRSPFIVAVEFSMWSFGGAELE